jgi:predicted aspartyl protease
MRSVATIAAGSLLASVAHAQVQWNIERREPAPTAGLRKRAASTYQETIINDKTKGGYFATVSVGTPAQKMTLQLDTGSSDIWVPYSGASVCSSSRSSTSTGGCTLGSCK